ncbi:MAG: hypothetical protein HXX19_15260 [Rhodoferax sp.]|nr:hypothetical protein [Rhodoferax sp.]
MPITCYPPLDLTRRCLPSERFKTSKSYIDYCEGFDGSCLDAPRFLPTDSVNNRQQIPGNAWVFLDACDSRDYMVGL